MRTIMDHGNAGDHASLAVLIVENNVLKRLVTATDLRRQGFDVFEAADVAEAKTILKTVVVDVLFSNVSLVDGRQLVRWLKQQRLLTRTFWVADAGKQPARNSLHS